MIRRKIGKLISLDDAAEQQVVLDGIRSAVEFRGAKLWILILAIFVASLGLNTNSAAVIIGAMLISPLMGPIIGMGMGLAIYDFDMLKRSVRNYLVATLFSVLTATIYFLISPFSEVQSELLARTSPTIYDVLIALCGGLAGIIALGSKSQRTGNVIPGVAIATALMPPLCTVGFGVATANWTFAAGALYLYVINTIFIAAATFVGGRWIMRFQMVSNMNKVREKRTRILMTIILICTIIPSIWLTISMVRESYFNQSVNRFIAQEMRWANTQVISHKNDYAANSFSVVLIGAEVDSLAIAEAEDKLRFYGLEGTQMQVMQTAFGVNEEDLRNMMSESNMARRNDEALIAQQQAEIHNLQQKMAPYAQIESLTPEIYAELQALNPQIHTLRMARGMVAHDSTVVNDTFLQIATATKLRSDEEVRLKTWLRQRTGMDNLEINFITSPYESNSPISRH